MVFNATFGKVSTFRDLEVVALVSGEKIRCASRNQRPNVESGSIFTEAPINRMLDSMNSLISG